jgi:hypothetical protein
MPALVQYTRNRERLMGNYSITAHPDHRGKQVRVPRRLAGASLLRFHCWQPDPALLLHQLHKLSQGTQAGAYEVFKKGPLGTRDIARVPLEFANDL